MPSVDAFPKWEGGTMLRCERVLAASLVGFGARAAKISSRRLLFLTARRERSQSFLLLSLSSRARRISRPGSSPGIA
jgi:hypothetical protein